MLISERIEKYSNMFFFNPFGFEEPFQEVRKSQSLGSGVIFDKKNGYLVTNNHVVQDAEEIKVILYDNWYSVCVSYKKPIGLIGEIFPYCFEVNLFAVLIFQWQ